MNFKCFVCSKQLYDETTAINHLRIVHFLKDGKNVFKCIVNSGANCTKEFSTFQGLRLHVRKCVNVSIKYCSTL